jgi:hypothetical protein
VLTSAANTPPPRESGRDLSKWAVLGVAIYWLCFYLAYPYRELIDDGPAKAVLLGQQFDFIRVVHQGLLRLQGALFEPSMQKAMVLGILLHLLLGWLWWRKILPRLAPDIRPLAGLGLLAFMVHPVSLQTAVHVAQRSEILGALSLALALWLVFAVPAAALGTKHLLGLGALAVLSLLCKETYLVAILGLVLVWMVARQAAHARRGLVAVALVLALLATGRTYLGGNIEPGTDAADVHRRTAAFVNAFASGQPVPTADSVLFPVRTEIDNLRTQVAVLPLVARAVLFPFALVKDVGFFPYGRAGYGWSKPWFHLGLALLLAGGAVAYRVLRRSGRASAILLCLPLFLYGTYWLVPLADPVVLYRLYGVVMLVMCLSLPIALKDVPKARAILAAILGVVVVAGLVRGYEMANPVREARLEVARAPDNYRVHITYLHALMDSGVRPVDCHAVMDPALARAPSTAFVYVELAWCLWNQKQQDEARVYARKALEQEVVPENLHIMLDMLIGPHGESVFIDKMHPANLRRMSLPAPKGGPSSGAPPIPAGPR